MPVNPRTDEDGRRRLATQIAMLVEDHGDDQVGWDAERPEESTYVCHRNTLLFRPTDRVAADDVVGILNGTGLFAGDVIQNEFPPDDSSRTALDLLELQLPGRTDSAEDARQVELAMQELDDQGVNTLEETVVAPDYWISLAGSGNGRLCPATEPEETGLDTPWPPPVDDQGLGDGVRVTVVDSGWDADTGQAVQWLHAVGGDPDEDILLPVGSGRSAANTTLRGYAGHGTFIAGVVRCLAPGAQVQVERFVRPSGALRESAMVRRLREALDSAGTWKPEPPPHIINLSAGSTTRQNRPMLSFERFWEQDLSEAPNCLLVAAAGNDATRDNFWPAAFPWALGVGSLDRDGKVSDFSNWGRAADVYTVGRNIVNAFPIGSYVCREAPNAGDRRVFHGWLARWSGTSFAAPIVAGLLAAELTGGGDVVSARKALEDRAAQTWVLDPDDHPVPALKADIF